MRTDTPVTQARQRPRRWLLLSSLLIAGFALAAPGAAADRYYDAAFRAELTPKRPTIRVELTLSGAHLPSRIEFKIDPRRHRAFSSDHPLSQTEDVVTWKPKGKVARIAYEFVATHERQPQRYDSLVTADWALFRADKMVPRISVTSPSNLLGRTTLEFALPPQWSVAAPYPQENGVYKIPDTKRRLDRPLGWLLVGKLGERSELIQGTQTNVAAPAGEGARRQDTLAFLNWNLPHLKAVFPDFPDRLLIVRAGDPMWRGGLSGPSSMFLHLDRPLISENRTSTLLHELVHIAMGIWGDHESDWIVEGLAEYYSMEILRRSGGISDRRYQEALERMARWARSSPSVFAPRSSGATTARAVMAFQEIDAELRDASGGRANLDHLAARLARRRGEVSLRLLQQEARQLAGRQLESLERKRLAAAPRKTQE